MIKGFFHGNIPYIDLDISWGTTTLTETFMIDTGFAGGIMLNPLLSAQLGLDILGSRTIRLADNTLSVVMEATSVIKIENEFNVVEVFISDGLPIVGMDFFHAFKYKLSIDCKERTVVLEK
jgi:predicted aspartyl protease